MINRDYFSEPIEIPYFEVGYYGCDESYLLNPFELRNLMERVAKGIVKPKGLYVYDIQANICTVFSIDEGDVIEGNLKDNLPTLTKFYSFNMRRLKAIRDNRLRLMDDGEDKYIMDSAINNKNNGITMDILLFKKSGEFYAKDLSSSKISKVCELKTGDEINLQTMYFVCRETVSDQELSNLISQGCILSKHKRFDDYLKHHLVFIPQYTDLVTLINN